MFPWKQGNTEIMEEMFSMQSMLICYKQDQLVVAIRELLRFSHCEPLLLVAGSLGRGQFGNPEEEEC
jgi:hypothetical protein